MSEAVVTRCVDLAEIIGAQKALILPPSWAGPEPDTGYLWFEAPLEIEGAVHPGLFLSGGCHEQHSDCGVSFELRLRQPPSRQYHELERLDWLPLDGGHSIPRRKKIPYGAGKRIEGTHWHIFEFNMVDGRLFDRLHVAVHPPYEIQTFQDLLVFCGRVFGISNMRLVTVPPVGLAYHIRWMPLTHPLPLYRPPRSRSLWKWRMCGIGTIAA